MQLAQNFVCLISLTLNRKSRVKCQCHDLEIKFYMYIQIECNFEIDEITSFHPNASSFAFFHHVGVFYIELKMHKSITTQIDAAFVDVPLSSSPF